MIQVSVNGESRELPDATSVAGLVVDLELTPEEVAVELNKRLVPRRERETTPLSDGDRVELVTLVGGG